MAVTRLKRKGKKNKTVSSQRTSAIKRLTATPVIKNVDVEALKEGFSTNGGSKPASKSKKEETTESTVANKKENGGPVAEKQEEPTKNHPTDKE